MIPNAWRPFDFGLGADVDALRDAVQGFAQDRIAPRADEIDRTNTFPREETYGLVSQIRRAASSIPCNIAEGCGRGSSVDMRRFLNMSRGSANEVDYQLQLATDLNMLDREVYVLRAAAVVEIQKMLKSLISTLGQN